MQDKRFRKGFSQREALCRARCATPAGLTPRWPQSSWQEAVVRLILLQWGSQQEKSIQILWVSHRFPSFPHFILNTHGYLAISLLTLLLISSSSTAVPQSEHRERGPGPSGVVKLERKKMSRSTTSALASFTHALSYFHFTKRDHR